MGCAKITNRFWILAIATVFWMQAVAGVHAEDNGNVVGRFEIFKDGDDLLVPVQVEGKTYQFQVDTGCAITVFDASLVRGEPLGKFDVETANDRVAVSTYNAPHAKLGTCDLRDTLSCVVGQDMTDLRKDGHDCYGIIGIDFLAHWVAEIDFDRGELSIQDKVTALPKDDPIEIVFHDSGLPMVRACIGSWCETEFFIDTGDTTFNSGMLESRQCGYLLRLDEVKAVGSAKFHSFSGASNERLVQAKNLELGSFKVANPIFSEGKQTALSLNYLSRFHVILDFPQKKMYLRPGRSFDKQNKQNLSGMDLERLEGKTSIHSIEVDSAAEKAGVQAGDLILKIDDQPAERMRLYEIKSRFCDTGSVRVLASRSGREYETTIALK